ncbi:MAG: DEAD/DEAH box helicase [Candidatus Sumerlaeaceae bacterium]
MTTDDQQVNESDQPAESTAAEPAAESQMAAFAGEAAEQILEPENALPEIKLEELPDSLRAAAAKANWTQLAPVQAKAIPYMLEGRDVMVQSRTGSGKTGAFLLPILARLDPHHPYCQALVMVPTRELASQVYREAEHLGAGSGIRTVAVYGGVGYGPQIDAFQKGAQLVIGTPGRVLDHLMKRSLDLEDLEIVVFDEADRMMSMGFYPDMRQIRGYLPRKRSGYMFSATYPAGVQNLAREFLHEPEFLSLSHGTVHIANMEHVYYELPPMDKDRCLVRIIEMENPASAIIFCNTKQRVNYVATVLQRFGYDADQLSADLSQKAREKVLDSVRAGNLRFLVATDVAARGIDIAHLSHVVLYEFPEDQESYIHRAGRTGRAGASGVCISLVSFTEIGELERVAKRYGIEMEKREVPTDEQVQAIVSERATALLEQKLRSRDRIESERMQRFIPLAKRLSESEDEMSVIAMLLDDYYQQTLHAPVALPDEPREPRAKPEPRPPQSGGRPQGGGRPGGGGGGGRRRSSGGGGRR